jgi:hypothetical protein
MIRPGIDEPEALEAGWPDDDVAREYEDLAELEDLDALAPATGGEGASVLVEVGALARAADELEAAARLWERGESATRLAEAETTADRVARDFEGMEVEELDALAHWDEEAESRGVPDDEIGRELELI